MKRTITITASPSRAVDIPVKNKSVAGIAKADSQKLVKLISEVA